MVLGERFELPKSLRTSVLQTDAFSHSATPATCDYVQLVTICNRLKGTRRAVPHLLVLFLVHELFSGGCILCVFLRAFQSGQAHRSLPSPTSHHSYSAQVAIIPYTVGRMVLRFRSIHPPILIIKRMVEDLNP